MFKGRMADLEIQTIRDATNKAWVLGSEKFKKDFEAKTGRKADPRQRGGDRKSAKWHSENQRL